MHRFVPWIAFLLSALLVSVGYATPEYFTTWTEYDPGGYLAVTESTVTGTNLVRNAACYVSKDFTAGYFEDVELRLQFTGGACSHADYTPFFGVLTLANTLTDWYNLETSPAFGIKWSRGPGGYYLAMTHEPTSTSTWSVDIEGDYSPGTLYYLSLTRDYDGGANATGQYVLRVCTANYYGETGAVLVATQTLDSPAGEQAAFRYAIVAQSRTNAGSQTASGTVSSLEFVTGGGSEDPPSQVASPNPANAATSVSVSSTLSWAAAAGADSYDLYFGESTGTITEQSLGNTTLRSYSPTLDYETEYHWRVDSVNAYGTTEGAVWTFTTATEAAQPANIEDFTDGDWSLVDTLSQLAIADTNEITATALNANHTAYVVKDFGADYFGGDLLCSWRSTVSSSVNLSFLGMLGLADVATDYQNMVWSAADAQLVYWRNTSGELRCYLTVLDDGTAVADYAALSAGTEYYFTLSRDNDGGTYGTGLLTLTVDTGNYRNLANSTAIDTLTVSVPADEQNSFRYALVGYSTTNQGTSSTITGAVSDLDVGSPTGSPGGGTGGEPGAPGAHGPYYVSPNGSNSYPGTSEADAWQTLAFALANATLDVTETNNIIYLMSGDHGSVSLTSKTWSSSSWSDEWDITFLPGARLSSLTINGVHDCFLRFTDFTVTQVGPHNRSTGNQIYLRDCSDLDFDGGTITGYYSSLDSSVITGNNVHIHGPSGGYVENITIQNILFQYGWDMIEIQGEGSNSIRSGLKITNCDFENWIQSAILANYPVAAFGSYDQIELSYNTVAKIEVARIGDPHTTCFQCRGANLLIRGNRLTNPGGSGVVRFYEAYGPFNNMTVEDNILYGYGGLSMVAGFFQLGENVRIANNTIIGCLRDGSNPLAYRYNGTCAIGTSTAVTPDIELYNNIFACHLDLGGSATYITGGNNLCYNYFSGGAMRATGEPNDIIICQGVSGPIEDGYTVSSFETPGEIFVGSANFADYWDTSGFRPTDWTVFAVPATSPAVDGGDVSSATASDVRAETRDATPDIGAWEYLTASPPIKSQSPSPANGATDVPVNTPLQWAGPAENWDIYVGTSAATLVLQANQQAPLYEYDLDYATTYYWRVDANNTYGTTTGDVWSFTTDDGLVNAVTGPQPINGAGNQPTSLTLRWAGATGAIGYNVYLGTDSLQLLTSTSATQAASGTLSQSTTYYWRVDAVGAAGTTTGTVWSFTTYTPGAGGSDPGTPTLPDLPTSGIRVRIPARIQERSDWMTSRYANQYQALTAVDVPNLTGLPQSYAVGAPGDEGDGLSGWLERIVVLADGSDTQWSLTVADAWGATLFAATDLDMTAGVATYDIDSLPFVGGLLVTIDDVTADTADAIRVRLYINEVWRR